MPPKKKVPGGDTVNKKSEQGDEVIAYSCDISMPLSVANFVS